MSVKFEVVKLNDEIEAFNLLYVPKDGEPAIDSINEWISYIKKNLEQFESALENEEFLENIQGKTLREVIFRSE